jgi:HSP20 family protein
MNELSSKFEINVPSVDVINRDGEIIIKAMMPGVEKKDIDITVTKNTVTIKAKAGHEEKEEKGDYYRCEISKGSSMRTLNLPADVDEDKVKAKFKDGLLELTLPKTEVSHRRSIKVD